ncbi:MAG: RidA family protein [Gemmatimonadaceae bacterium]
MTPQRQLIASGSPFEARIGFSRAVRVGAHVAVAGTAPIGDDGKTVGHGDPAAQASRCIHIAEAALAQAGCSLNDVIRTRVLLTRIEDWPAVAAVHGAAFGDIRPACTVVQVSRFVDPDWLVELEVDAISSHD